jgi:tetratricopeptide (TPR) repeat protein
VIRDGAGARKRIETAQRLMKSWQYQEAIDELNAAIRMAPDFATAYNERGFAWFKLSEYARAIADLDSAIRLNPKYANAYHIRGVVREAQGDHAGAEMDIRREKLLRLALISTR